MNFSDEEIKKMPITIFKSLVKKKTFSASLTYLKSKQLKGEKVSNIIYTSLQLLDYLNPCSN